MECNEKDEDFLVDENLSYYISKYVLPRIDTDSNIPLQYKGFYLVFILYYYLYY